MRKVDPQGVWGIHHAVVCGDVDRGVRGDTHHETGEGPVDQLKLITPLPGLAAVHVPHLVELSPVEIDEGTLAGPHCGQRRINPCLEGVRRLERPTSQRRSGQSRTVEESGPDAGDGQAVGSRALKNGLARLPHAWIRTVFPGPVSYTHLRAH